ncbi:DUF982 domain-containing protein [Mesorhizobium sp.]|uniref:DUF982 domain-containing protein n=1 Tax=Mesorhizobium sp. TaxID=1871066 RepID=UPI00344CBFC3
MVQEIADLVDATGFLEEWPEDRRNLIHETALRACYQAHAELRPMSVARDAFVGFAKRAGILEDPEAVLRGSLLPNRAAARCRCSRIRRCLASFAAQKIRVSADARWSLCESAAQRSSGSSGSGWAVWIFLNRAPVCRKPSSVRTLTVEGPARGGSAGPCGRP